MCSCKPEPEYCTIELFHVTSQSREKCLVSHVGVQIFIISQPKRRVGLTIDTINHSHGFVPIEALWARDKEVSFYRIGRMDEMDHVMK